MSQQMTSRERVLTTLNHREPDRVPIDFNGHRSSGIMIQAYKKLREYLGLPVGELYMYDFVQQLAIVEDDLLERLGVDVVQLGYDYYKRPEYWRDFILHDGTQCKIPWFIDVESTPEGFLVRGDYGQPICLKRPDSLYFEQTYFPQAEKNDELFEQLATDYNQIMWCRLRTPPSPGKFESEAPDHRRADAQKLRQQSDRAIYAIFGGNLIEIGSYCFRMDNFLALLAENPNRAHRFLDKVLEGHLENLDKFLDAVGDSIDVIGFGDDLGMQTGPLVSPRMFKTFFKNRYATMWQRVHDRFPHLKICLHCCGGVYPLLRDLIEAGLDAINPVQFTCKDMELTRLKNEFGRDLVFWGGGCDTRDILPLANEKQIARHVKENIAIMEPNGGFVFQQVHNIMANVSPQNIVAMFDAVKDHLKQP